MSKFHIIRFVDGGGFMGPYGLTEVFQVSDGYRTRLCDQRYKDLRAARRAIKGLTAKLASVVA